MVKKNVLAIAVIVFGIIITTLFSLLCLEYSALISQHEKLRFIKKEYRHDMWNMKQLLEEYQVMQKRLYYFESLFGDTALCDNSNFAQTISEKILAHANQQDIDNDMRFVVLNRDPEYLKRSTYDYLKQQDLDFLLRTLSHDVWLDYTHQVLSKDEKKVVSVKKNTVRKPKKSVSSSRMPVNKNSPLFSWPIDRSYFWLSSTFGNRKVKNTWRFHYGIDMAALKGTPVKAAASGIVIEAREAKGFGKTIVIQHNKKYKTRYAHLDKIHVCVGQKVARGKRIGDVGDTGFVHTSRTDASHLHFELSLLGERVNPLYYLI